MSESEIAAAKITAAKPFKIAIPDETLDDLKQRLENTRWPEEVENAGWDLGMPLSYLKEICTYWKDEYNWREREELLNRFEQFKMEIDGLNIHFIHVRSNNENALPIIITHGWPGSIVEFQKIIDPLVNPEAHGGSSQDAFDVICPSLPGYGFSDIPLQLGWNTEKIGHAWGKLAANLGYDKYLAQGGDWGSMVTTRIGQFDPEHCIGIHLNMPIAGPDPETMDSLTPQEQAALESLGHYDRWDSGYSKQQSSRPQTLAYGLTDSPAGQAAWIIEKFWAWTDCDGHPENVLTRDELLDNVMLYWCTATAGSSARLYYESFHQEAESIAIEVKVPTGCCIYPKEIIRSSQRWAEKRYTNIIQWTEQEKGGHFAAFEQPELYIEDVRKFARNFR